MGQRGVLATSERLSFFSESLDENTDPGTRLWIRRFASTLLHQIWLAKQIFSTRQRQQLMGGRGWWLAG